MDIYGKLSPLEISPIFGATAVSKKAKGLYLVNNTGAATTFDIKLYSPAPDGGTPITVTIPFEIGASIIIPARVHSAGPGYVAVYEIY